MARLNTNNTSTSTPETSTNLERMLVRLQNVLLSSRVSKHSQNYYEREKLNANLEYARSLLVAVEQDSLNIKVQTKKQEVQADCIRKRELIRKLSNRLEELNELASREDGYDTSEGEDLIGQYTPSETTDETTTHDEGSLPSPTDHTPESADGAGIPPLRSQTSPVESSTLRSRNTHSDLFHAPANPTRAFTTATSTSASTTTAPPKPTTSAATTTETLLSHNRNEQEELTSSLLNLATKLKESSQSFASTLASDTHVLDSAVAGMDRNELGLEAASKRMGYLRTMTEGKGWWGRMLMYANIGGLMVLALVIVFVLPKLRF